MFAVDFGMPVNQPVAAVAPGRVIRAWAGGTNLARGCNRAFANNANYVVVDHGGGLSSLYLHLNSVDVKVGDPVQQGQIVGKSGDTGWICGGAHLHFAFQQTPAPGSYLGTTIRQGFVETNNGQPILNRSYTSRNRSGIPNAAMLVNQGSGRALDGGGANGTVYPHPTPNSSNTFHRWRFDRIAGTNEYIIISVHSGRALDAGGANGEQAYTHPNPNPSNTFHRWRLQPSGAGYMVISVATGRALDGGGANGGQIYMHPRPDGNPFQVWLLN